MTDTVLYENAQKVKVNCNKVLFEQVNILQDENKMLKTQIQELNLDLD